MARAIYLVACSAILVAFLWGLRAFMTAGGERFAEGFALGMAFLLGLLLLYRRFVGPMD